MSCPEQRVVKTHEVLLPSLGTQGGGADAARLLGRHQPAPSPVPETKPHSCPCSFLQGRVTETGPLWVPEDTTWVTPGVARQASPFPPDPVLRVAPRLPRPRSWPVLCYAPSQPVTAEAPPHCPPWHGQIPEDPSGTSAFVQRAAVPSTVPSAAVKPLHLRAASCCPCTLTCALALEDVAP